MASTSDPTKPETSAAQDQLETVLGAVAQAGEARDDAGDIAADDAGASKLATEIDRRRERPTDAAAG